ncbi:MAG: LPS assembly lipoprotein LptE [Bacteroidota bacterium]|nr:LPS assembly lipoprotein LptE [Bacteroidota bacterium]
MKYIIAIILSNIIIASCGIYSFTGASIPDDAKTVSVSYFKTTTNSPSSLNETMTEELKNLLLSQTDLNLQETESDINFIGEIIKYKITPMAIQANETAGKNRLTIEIKMEYKNNFNKKENFESIFSRYRDFSSSENLVDVESVLIEEITTELLEDVFNKAFVNW